jgi:hypothetical protein
LKRKPFYQKRAWWGWLAATVAAMGVAVVKTPGPLGIAEAIAVLGVAIGTYSVQEVQREIGIQGTKKL